MILTVGSDENLREQVSEGLRDTRWAATVAMVTSVGEAQEIMRGATPPRVVIVGPTIGVGGAAEVAATGESLREPPVVLFVGTPTTELLRAAMRAGIRDVLPTDFGEADLVGSLSDAGVSATGPAALPGLTVAVFSTKGGVGTSVVASNLAVLLGERIDGPSTLIDLDLASADQSIMHGLSPRWTIQDVADGMVGLDAESLDKALVPIKGSNCRLMPGPVDPALAETISAADVGSVISAVRARSRIAVLDTASGFDDRTLTALDAADVTVVVSSLDVSALRSLTVSLQTMERLGIDRSSILVVLVRVDSKSGLVVADVERAIDREIDVGVPSTRNVPRSVNEGVPLAVSTPRSSVVSALEELVELILARLPASVAVEDPGSRGGGGFFSWSRSKAAPSSKDTDGGAPPPPHGADPAAEPIDDDTALDISGHDPAFVAEARSTAQDVGEDLSDVRSLRREARQELSPRGVAQRPVRRRRSSIPRADVEATPGGGTEREHEVADDDVSAERSDPVLEELPPPTVVSDDDDDQPRRWRRR